MNNSLRNEMDDPTLPTIAPGEWIVDPTASSIRFVAPLMLGLKVRGGFERHESTITVAPIAEQSTVKVCFTAASIATGNKTRDKHLRAPNVFDVDNHADVVFTSTSVTPTTRGVRVVGELRVRDVVRPLTLDAKLSSGPTGAPRFTATTVVATKGLGFTRKGVNKTVTVEIDIQLKPA